MQVGAYKPSQLEQLDKDTVIQAMQNVISGLREDVNDSRNVLISGLALTIISAMGLVYTNANTGEDTSLNFKYVFGAGFGVGIALTALGLSTLSQIGSEYADLTSGLIDDVDVD